MLTGPLARLDHLSRSLTPLASTLVVAIVSAVPWHIPEIGRVTPALTLMCVYYWAIHRPDLFPASAVFLLGLLQDALMGGPIGLNALLFLIAYGVAGSQRVFFSGKSFPVVWWGFMMVAAAVHVLNWLAVLLLAATPVSPWPAIFSYLLSIAAYPLGAALLVLLHRTTPRAEQAR
jgi:rod shape-determining protein MreD